MTHMNSWFLGKRLPWLQQIAVWIFAFYVSWNIVDNGYQKLTLDPDTSSFFLSIGLPIKAMVMAGIVEVFGSLLLFIPQISFYAAIPVFLVMGTASYYNQASDPVTMISAVSALIIALLSRPPLLRKNSPITKIIV